MSQEINFLQQTEFNSKIKDLHGVFYVHPLELSINFKFI